MLKDAKSFSSFSVDDIGRAKKFYGITLGLDVRDGAMGLLELHLGAGHPLIIYPKHNHEPATFTVLNFVVDDLEAAVNQLIAKGVKFEQYTGDISTDTIGISRGGVEGPDVAWFCDPARNILAIMKLP